MVPHYRVPVFARLARRLGGLTVYATRFASDIPGADCRVVRAFGLGPVVIHPTVLFAVITLKHRVWLCQGRLGLLTSGLLALGGRALRIRVLWWTPLWRPRGTIALDRGPHGWLMALLMRASAGVVAYGTTARDVAIEAGIDPRHVAVAYNALDTHRLLAAERAWIRDNGRLVAFAETNRLVSGQNILFVGQLIPRKRLEDLLIAFKSLVGSADAGTLSLLIIGNGPARASLQALAEGLRLGDSVRFLGAITDVEAICPFFLLSRVVVLPGAGGLVVNQAMTHGVPVIVGGGDGTEIDAIEHGKNGLFWAGDSVESLAALIRQVLGLSPEEWVQWSARARAAVAKTANVDRMIDGIMEAIDPQGSGGSDGSRGIAST